MADLKNLFKDLEIEAFRAGITPRTKESIEWFRKKIRQMYGGRSITRRGQLMQADELELKTRPQTKGPAGNMYMYFYDPKTKQQLPYYDSFPLIIMMGPAEGGFYGLNLHYLPPVMRAKVIQAVLGGDGVPQQFVEPAYKRYLFSHVRSRFALVEEPEWEIATFLPTAEWNKSSATRVYADTRRKVRG